MIALAAMGGEARNAALKGQYKIDLKKAAREKLNGAGLLTSIDRKGKTRMVHTLTDKGWAFVEGEMVSDLPARAGAAGGALYALLHSLRPVVVNHPGGLKGLLSNSTARGGEKPDTLQQKSENPHDNLVDEVRIAYSSLARRQNEWVSLRELRTALGPAPHSNIDAALYALHEAKQAYFTLEEDQTILTEEDRKSAIRLGGDYMYYIRMG